MNPADLRNLTWEKIQGRLEGNRLAVWHALSVAGTRTTRQLAAEMEWDVLNVRPRVTELVDLALAECTGRVGGEGLYRARTLEEARESWRVSRAARDQQVLLKL